MISLSTAALEQIRHSAETGDMQGLPLRVAVVAINLVRLLNQNTITLLCSFLMAWEPGGFITNIGMV